MTAADRREELEAAIWRLGALPLSPNAVRQILAAADTYATALAAETLDGMVRTRRTSDRRDALAEARRAS